MPIRDLQSYINALWDWACLDGCFGNSKTRPTDLDGLVERRGHFLFLEAKGPGKVIPTGQEILFKRLVKHPEMTVLIVWGKPGVPEKIRLISHQKDHTYHTADLSTFRTLVTRWWAMANTRRG